MSDFRLYPLPESKLDVISNIVKLAHMENNLGERCSVEEAMERLVQGYAARCAAVYVDDLSAPSSCLILWGGSLIVVEVLLLYLAPELRADREARSVMRNTASNYARLNGADFVLGSSRANATDEWLSKLWLDDGFSETETFYVKKL